MIEFACSDCMDGPCYHKSKTNFVPFPCTHNKISLVPAKWLIANAEKQSCDECGKKVNFVIMIAKYNGKSWISKWVCKTCLDKQ